MPLFFLIALASQGPAESIDDFLRPDGRTRVIAHRGFSGAAPENTLSAFRKAIEVGADMFELDVLLSSDGHVVVIHDDTLERTTNGEGRVVDHTLEELTSLDAGAWFSEEFAGERIPTLEQALRLARGRILVNVEIKTEAVTDDAKGGIVEKTLTLVDALDMKGQVVISSFDPRALAHARELDPEARTASLYNRRHHEGKTPREILDEVGSRGLSMSQRQVSEQIVEACHGLGRPVAVYTVNEENDLIRILELGVDAIFTDRPDRLLDLLGRREDARTR